MRSSCGAESSRRRSCATASSRRSFSTSASRQARGKCTCCCSTRCSSTRRRRHFQSRASCCQSHSWRRHRFLSHSRSYHSHRSSQPQRSQRRQCRWVCCSHLAAFPSTCQHHRRLSSLPRLRLQQPCLPGLRLQLHHLQHLHPHRLHPQHLHLYRLHLHSLQRHQRTSSIFSTLPRLLRHHHHRLTPRAWQPRTEHHRSPRPAVETSSPPAATLPSALHLGVASPRPRSRLSAVARVVRAAASHRLPRA